MATFEQEVAAELARRNDPILRSLHVNTLFAKFIDDADAVNQFEDARRYLQLPDAGTVLPDKLFSVHDYPVANEVPYVWMGKKSGLIPSGVHRSRGTMSIGLMIAPFLHSSNAPQPQYLCARTVYSEGIYAKKEVGGFCDNDPHATDNHIGKHVDSGDCFPIEQPRGRLRDALHRQLVLICATATESGQLVNQLVAPHQREIEILKTAGILHDTKGELINAVTADFRKAHPPKDRFPAFRMFSR